MSGVGAHHPRQRLAGEAEFVADARQCDRHHGDVEDEHELRDAEQGQHAPSSFGHVTPPS